MSTVATAIHSHVCWDNQIYKLLVNSQVHELTLNSFALFQKYGT